MEVHGQQQVEERVHNATVKVQTSRRAKRGITLIVKVVSTCNLACRYCDADTYSNLRMSLDTISQIIKKALNYADHVEFIWHGGEPLLMGIQFYEKVVELQKRYRREGQTIVNTLQTNGTLISQEWVDFFKANGFHVGVSLDGPPEVHNANRIFRNGQGSFEQVMRGIRLLRENGVKFGVLAVITKETVRLGAKRFLDFFIENGIFSIGILPQRPALNIGRTDALPREEFEKFAIELFDYWYSLDDPRIRIREFDAILSRILGARSGFCIFSGDCVGRFLGITPDGDVYHCDEFMFDERYKLGNVREQTFEEMLNPMNPKLLRIRLETEGTKKSISCKYSKICNYGCPKDRYVLSKVYNEEGTCGWCNVIDHIYKRVMKDLGKIKE
ncbi:MAG: radical SAM protein [Sulfolobales archaeon]|nr:radical SAM protein [Sulfolobales archaeon]